jgi:hypothetical protein
MLLSSRVSRVMGVYGVSHYALRITTISIVLLFVVFVTPASVHIFDEVSYL